MTSRFEKFSERARRVLSLAQEEAKRFNHNHIDTEHILLGLLKEKEGVAATVLINLGIDLSKAITAVEFIISKRDKSGTGEIGLTPRAKKVIELAVDEARRLNHNYIGTEHLLIGLLREGEGVAAGVLDSLQVNLDNLREQTEKVLEEVFQQSQSSPSHSAQSSGPKTKTPTLDQLGVDLTQAAKSNKLEDQVFWYKAEERPDFKIGAPSFWKFSEENFTDEKRDDNPYSQKPKNPLKVNKLY